MFGNYLWLWLISLEHERPMLSSSRGCPAAFSAGMLAEKLWMSQIEKSANRSKLLRLVSMRYQIIGLAGALAFGRRDRR